MEMQKRFVDIFGLEEYTDFIVKNNGIPFETALDKYTFSPYKQYYTSEPGIMCLEFGDKKFYAISNTKMVKGPVDKNFSFISCNIIKFATFSTSFEGEIIKFIKTGKISQEQKIMETVYYNVFYVKSVIVGTKPEGSPNEYRIRKLTALGFTYNEEKAVWEFN